MILYGKPVADALREQYAEWIEAMAWKRTLAVIKDDTSDKGYMAAIQREAERWQVRLLYAESHLQAGRMGAFTVLDVRKPPVSDAFCCFYDVDGQNDAGRVKAYVGEICEYTPCTAEAIIRMLDYYDIPIAGKHAVVIGRSERVGKPTAMLLLARDATVTVCHSKTEKGNLLDLVAGADIVVCASGQKGLISWRTCVPDGCTVINVGGDYVCDGYDEYDPGINLIPFKGGVGPVTTAVLMSHVLM
nr:MAG TPA: Tetrahydrofolate dehydrogenase/cyclohydrolase, NAD(P)-binding domain [Caudoviricetes sp.]